MNPAAKRKKIVLDVKKAVIFALNVEAQIRKGILGSATILFYKKSILKISRTFLSRH